MFLSLVFSISISFSLYLFLTRCLSRSILSCTRVLFLCLFFRAAATGLLTNVHCTKLSALSVALCVVSHHLLRFFSFLSSLSSPSAYNVSTRQYTDDDYKEYRSRTITIPINDTTTGYHDNVYDDGRIDDNDKPRRR